MSRKKFAFFYFYRATLCVSGLSHRKSFRPSICPSVTTVNCAHIVRLTIRILRPMTTLDSSFQAPNLSPYANGMAFIFMVKYKWNRQNVVFSIKTASISETVSDTAKVTIDH